MLYRFQIIPYCGENKERTRTCFIEILFIKNPFLGFLLKSRYL